MPSMRPCEACKLGARGMGWCCLLSQEGRLGVGGPGGSRGLLQDPLGDPWGAGRKLRGGLNRLGESRGLLGGGGARTEHWKRGARASLGSGGSCRGSCRGGPWGLGGCGCSKGGQGASTPGSKASSVLGGGADWLPQALLGRGVAAVPALGLTLQPLRFQRSGSGMSSSA